MRRALTTVAAGLALAAAAFTTAQAMPVQSDAGFSTDVIKVSGGCGPYGHRGPWGGCRPGGGWGGPGWHRHWGPGWGGPGWHHPGWHRWHRW